MIICTIGFANYSINKTKISMKNKKVVAIINSYGKID